MLIAFLRSVFNNKRFGSLPEVKILFLENESFDLLLFKSSFVPINHKIKFTFEVETVVETLTGVVSAEFSFRLTTISSEEFNKLTS